MQPSPANTLALQRTVGNRAVGRLLGRQRSESSRTNSRHISRPDLARDVEAAQDGFLEALQRRIRQVPASQRRLGSAGRPPDLARSIQRQHATTAEEAGIWSAPFALGTASTKQEAWEVAGLVWLRLYNTYMGLRRADAEAELERFDIVVDEAGAWLRYLANEVQAGHGDEPLSGRDARNLTDFGRDAKRGHHSAVAAMARRAQRALAPIADAEPPNTEAEESQLAEALHFAFIEDSESQVESIKEAIGNIKDYKDKVTNALTWARRASDLVGAADTVADLDRVLDRLGSAGGLVDKVSDVLTAAKAFSTLSGLDNQAISESRNMINQFEAGLDTIDLAMGFFKGAPLVSALWTSYYAPLTRTCLRLLGVISRQVDYQGRVIGVIDFWQ